MYVCNEVKVQTNVLLSCSLIQNSTGLYKEDGCHKNKVENQITNASESSHKLKLKLHVYCLKSVHRDKKMYIYKQ